MDKKKRYVELNQVSTFIDEQTERIQAEYNCIVEMLEHSGTLSMPYGEKLSGKNLFAIRVIQAGNIRIFYVYGYDDKVYGIYGYEKKTRKIPVKEMKKAENIAKLLRQEGLIKWRRTKKNC